MLVLDRRKGDRVVIPGSRVVIEVVEVSGSAVKLGFRAPRDVDIFRGEIWDRMAFEEWDGEPQHEEDVT